MAYTPNAGAVVPRFTLAADVTNGSTFTCGYPSGFVQGDFTAGMEPLNGSFVIVNSNDKYKEDVSSATGVAFSFGASLVTITNNTGATIKAGATIDVWLDQVDGNSSETFAFPLDLASITAADIVAAFRPGVDGIIENVEIIVNKPATTGSKLATLTPKVSAVAVTGGVVALTSANMTPMGARVAGSQVTAGGAIKKSDSLSITASAVTAFVEGSATLMVRIRKTIV